MRTSTVIVALLLLAGCAKKAGELKDVLPVEVQRTWTLKRTKPVQAPALVTGLGLQDGIEAHYEGNGAINVQLYEMRVEASAFELIQKWRQADGLAINAGKYFIIATPEGPVDAPTTSSFLQEMRQNILKPSTRP